MQELHWLLQRKVAVLSPPLATRNLGRSELTPRGFGGIGGDSDPAAGQPGHQLPGAAGSDAEEFLDGLAVEVARVNAAEDVENF